MSFNARKNLKKFVSIQQTYILTSNVNSVNEGGSVTFILTTTNVLNGTSVPYTISGVSTSDIDNASLNGNFVVNNNTASITLSITADNLTEDTESLVLTSGGQTKTVTINDTSTTPATVQTMSLSSSDIVVLGEEYLLGLSRPTTTYPIIPRTSLYEDLWKIKSIKIKSNPIAIGFNKLLIDDYSPGYLFFKTYSDSNVEIWLYSNDNSDSIGYNTNDFVAGNTDHINSWIILLYDKSTGYIHYYYNRGLFIEGNKIKNRVFPLSGWEKYETDPLTEEPILDANGSVIYTPANFEFEIGYNTTYVSPYIVDGVSTLNLQYSSNGQLLPIPQKPTALYIHKTFSASSVWWLAAENRVYRSSNFGKTWSNSPASITASKYISTGINVGYNRSAKIIGFFATSTYLYAFTNNGIYRAALSQYTIDSDSSAWTLHNSGIEVIAMYNETNSYYPSIMTSDGTPKALGDIQNSGVNETLIFGNYGQLGSPSVESGISTISMTPDLYLTSSGYVSRNSETQTQNAFHSSNIPYIQISEPITKGFIVSNGQSSSDNAICYVGYGVNSNAYFTSNLVYNINTSISIGYDVKYGAGYFDNTLPAGGGSYIFLPDKDQLDSEQSRKIGYTSSSSGKLLREELQLPISDNWIQFFKVK